MNINPDSVDFFAQHAHEWWDEKGSNAPLHALNWARLAFICAQLSSAKEGHTKKQLQPLKGLRILDIGCGGGILAEPLCRLGGSVIGLDAGEQVIKVAKTHAHKMNLPIEYVQGDIATFKPEKLFDVVIASEVIEHVENVSGFLAHCVQKLDKRGTLILSTLNRTAFSYLLGIIAAERLLKWVPKGAHQWHKFLRPGEVAQMLEAYGMELTAIQGMTYKPLQNEWQITNNLKVNYILAAKFYDSSLSPTQ